MDFLRWAYYCPLLLACATALWRYKKLDRALKIFAALLVIGCLSEIAAYYAAEKFRNNYPVYNIYSLLELMLLCLYFNYSVDVLGKKHIGVYIGIVGLLVALTDLLWLQKGSLHRANAAFIFLENIIVISLGLLAVARMAVKPEARLTGQVHFRLTVLLVFFFSLDFPYHYIYDYIVFVKHAGGVTHVIMECSNAAVNIAFYMAVTIVFLQYPKSGNAHG